MITATLQEAKAKLNQLVEAARAGKQVVLLRGSEVVATLVPVGAEDLEIAPHLTDAQAERFWKQVDGEQRKKFGSASQAVRHLKKRDS